MQWALPLKDGKCLCIYTDVEKTCASIAKFSKKDADTYRSMHKRFDEMMKAIGGPQTYYPMGPAPLMAAHAESTDLGRQMYKMAEKTPEEVVCEMYENDVVRTLMLYACCHWGLDYSQSGVGFMLAIYMDRLANYYLVAGGSHRISNAILKRYFEAKGQVRTSAQIKRFIIENGTAKGVELEDGTQYLADKAVISTIDPHPTFLGELVYRGDSFTMPHSSTAGAGGPTPEDQPWWVSCYARRSPHSDCGSRARSCPA